MGAGPSLLDGESLLGPLWAYLHLLGATAVRSHMGLSGLAECTGCSVVKQATLQQAWLHPFNPRKAPAT